MTAQLEERDKLHETTEETDVTLAEMVEMATKVTGAPETDTMETDTTETDATETDATETDAMETDATDKRETDVLKIHLVTSNDLRDLPPSARR
jgi:hypothetical protein